MDKKIHKTVGEEQYDNNLAAAIASALDELIVTTSRAKNLPGERSEYVLQTALSTSVAVLVLPDLVSAMLVAGIQSVPKEEPTRAQATGD